MSGTVVACSSQTARQKQVQDGEGSVAQDGEDAGRMLSGQTAAVFTKDDIT
jgi:hypothetical protein